MEGKRPTEGDLRWKLKRPAQMPGVPRGDQEDFKREEGDYCFPGGAFEQQWEYWGEQAELRL